MTFIVRRKFFDVLETTSWPALKLNSGQNVAKMSVFQILQMLYGVQVNWAFSVATSGGTRKSSVGPVKSADIFDERIC
jgi:hypothetical protein